MAITERYIVAVKREKRREAPEADLLAASLNTVDGLKVVARTGTNFVVEATSAAAVRLNDLFGVLCHVEREIPHRSDEVSAGGSESRR